MPKVRVGVIITSIASNKVHFPKNYEYLLKKETEFSQPFPDSEKIIQ